MSGGGDAGLHGWGPRGVAAPYAEATLASEVGSEIRDRKDSSDCISPECRDKILPPGKRQSGAPGTGATKSLPSALVDVSDTSIITMHGMAASMIRRVLDVRPSKLVRYYHTCLGLSKTLLTFRDAESLPEAATNTKLFPLPLPFP